MSPAPLPQTPLFHVLIVAAGVGARLGVGVPKQYRDLAGRPVLAHTLAAFAAVSELWHSLNVVIAPSDAWFDPCMPNCDAHVLRCGGDTRARSVQNGLQQLVARGVSETDWVLVHDAARCLVAAQDLRELVRLGAADPVGAILAVPLADTLKAEVGGRCNATLARGHKWLAQTPQMFRLGALREALGHALEHGPQGITDEASVMELAGQSALLVAATQPNFKITVTADLQLAQALLSAQRANP